MFTYASKRSCFSTPFGNQRVNGLETLMKSFEFLKCAWNFEHSQKKEEYPSLIITEIIASEWDVYLRV